MNRAFGVVTFAALAALSLGAAHAQPEMKKVLRVSFPTAETGFDPQAAGDVYSNAVNRVIFDAAGENLVVVCGNPMSKNDVGSARVWTPGG